MDQIIFPHIHRFRATALAGICKNAGKTTVLNRILREVPADETLALTSIGRDGETWDLVTGTQKPGIFVRQGTLLATAAGLLRHCDITREILAATGVATPLGEVIVLRALSDGQVQLAGPSVTEQLVSLSQLFWRFGASRILIDGAVGRKSLCSRRVAEATVLCAGASFGGMEATLAETAHICRILQTPALPGDPPDTREKFVLCDKQLHVRGAVTDHFLLPLLRGLPEGVTVIAQDASRLLLSASALHKLELRGGSLAVRDGITLAAVAVNPYSAYGSSFDAAEFLQKMTARVDVPVIDVGSRQ
ncbi:MAG: hypothetical protein FWF10_01315 [Clostridiales bacterium]|nr:hypothetical protein [Clostridiales bacterium]